MFSGSEGMGWWAKCVGQQHGPSCPGDALSSSCPDGLALLGSFVDRVAPVGPILCSPSQWSGAMLKAFNDTFRVSLKCFLWPPCERFPCSSSLYRRLLGIRSSDIRMRWPAGRSWCCMRMVWMLGSSARARTLVSGTLSCHLISMRRLRQVVWESFSFLASRYIQKHQ